MLKTINQWDARGVTRKFTGRRQPPPQIVCSEIIPTNIT